MNLCLILWVFNSPLSFIYEVGEHGFIILSFNDENGGWKQLENYVIFIGFAITLHVWFRRFVLGFFVEISWNVIL